MHRKKMKNNDVTQDDFDDIEEALDLFGETIDEDNDDSKCLGRAYDALDKLKRLMTCAQVV